MVGRRYRGPGFRIATNWVRLVDLGASETGNLVCEVLDEGERTLLWFAHRVGAMPNPDPDVEEAPAAPETTQPAGATLPSASPADGDVVVAVLVEHSHVGG